MPTIELPKLESVLKESFKTGEEGALFKEQTNDVSQDTDPNKGGEQDEQTPGKSEDDAKKEPPKKGLKSFQEVSDIEEKEDEKKPDIQVEEFARNDGEKDSSFIKRMKSELASTKNTIKQLQEQLSKTPKDTGSLDELKKQLDDREALIERLNYQESAAYQNTFGKPIAKAVENTKNLVGQFTETKGVFERARALQGKERLDFLKEHADDGASVIFDRMAQLDELEKDRDVALGDRSNISKSLQKESENSEGAKIMEAFHARAEDMSKRFSAYRSEHADSFKQQAEALLTGNASEEDVIAAAYIAPMIPFYMQQIKDLQKENATLKARVGEINDDTPGINGRGRDGSSKVQSDSILSTDGKLKPLNEVLKGGFKGLGKKVG